MNRRDLLKNIGISSAAVLATSVPSLAELKDQTTDEFMFQGWRIKWRDWVRCFNRDIMVGLWVAYSTDRNGWHIISPYPGRCGPIVEGQMFDISLQDDQQYTSGFISDEELEERKRDALVKLKSYIAKVGSPPIERPF